MNIDFDWAVMIVAIVVLCVLFAGEPDIADAIIYSLTDGKIGGGG